MQRKEKRAEKANKNRYLTLLLAMVMGVLAVWQLVGMTGILGPAIAPPSAVVAGVAADGPAFYGMHVPVTLTSASVGYFWGNLAAIGAAALATTVPVLEKLVLQAGIASACIPLIAIAPILAACFDGVVTSAIMAAISVFFTTLVATINGLRHADPLSKDVVRAYGGGRYLVLRKVVAQSSSDVVRTWGITLVSSLIAGLGFAAVNLAEKILTPWAAAVAGDRS